MPRGTLTWTSNFDRFLIDFGCHLGPSESWKLLFSLKKNQKNKNLKIFNNNCFRFAHPPRPANSFFMLRVLNWDHKLLAPRSPWNNATLAGFMGWGRRHKNKRKGYPTTVENLQDCIVKVPQIDVWRSKFEAWRGSGRLLDDFWFLDSSRTLLRCVIDAFWEALGRQVGAKLEAKRPPWALLEAS